MEKEVPSLLELCARFLAPRLTRTQLSLLPIEDLRETLQRHMSRDRQVELFDEYKAWWGGPNDQLWRHSHFKDDKRHGEYKGWWSNGQLWWHSHYKDGKKHGEYKTWHRDGQLRYHEHWKDGVYIKDYLKEAQ